MKTERERILEIHKEIKIVLKSLNSHFNHWDWHEDECNNDNVVEADNYLTKLQGIKEHIDCQ